jgi:hypothetical protein
MSAPRPFEAGSVNGNITQAEISKRQADQYCQPKLAVEPETGW